MYNLYAKAVTPQGTFGTGWLPSLPDTRDYTTDNPKIKVVADKLKLAPKAIPTQVDWRQYCSPIFDQGNLGSCTANAAVGVVEYYERLAFNTLVFGSRLFVYKATRNLLGVVGDTGAWLRNTMGALVLCGIPPEKYWPYTDEQQPGPAGERYFDTEPNSFVYAVADNYESVSYFCHDPIGANVPKPTVVASVKAWIANKFPSMFGFWGFPSFNHTDVPGGIPYPCPGEQAIWGHAIVVVGYDDAKVITNTQCNKQTKGAFLIRNSWGTAWGDHGYGWLPYDYVLSNFAMDFWSLVGMKWVNTGVFGL